MPIAAEGRFAGRVALVTGAAYLVDGGSLASKETWLLAGA